MSHVVSEPCALCEKERRDAPCVRACPEAAFLETSVQVDGKSRSMNVIDPLACTDCRACVPVCPSRPGRMGAVYSTQLFP
jgi:NAD-dependent dihydropyrimidine dehydrogenase PreA subunit